MFLVLIGLVDSGIVRRQPSGVVPVGLGINGRLIGWPTLVFVFALLLTLILMVWRVRGAILIGILAATALAIVIESVAKVGPSFTPPDQVNPTGWSLNVPAFPSADKVLTTPDLGLLGKFNVLGSWQTAGWLVALMFAFTLLLTDFFDTMGTMVAVGQEGGLLNENGEPPRTREILLVDSIAAAAGGAASVSSNTSYIESAAGVGEGARTGAANLVTGGCSWSRCSSRRSWRWSRSRRRRRRWSWSGSSCSRRSAPSTGPTTNSRSRPSSRSC
jgi:AGZA family xanthine/uracil permease-like MFS transporter